MSLNLKRFVFKTPKLARTDKWAKVGAPKYEGRIIFNSNICF